MSIAYHFEDCPFNCNSFGKILDDNIGELVPCPHCSEKRKRLLKENKIVEKTDSGSEVVRSTAEMLGLFFDENSMNEDTLEFEKNKIKNMFLTESSSDEEAVERARDGMFISDRLVYDQIVPEGEKVLIDKDSIDRQKEAMEEVYQFCCAGIIPGKSYCFGITRVGRFEFFVYPCLLKAYRYGLTVAPFCTISDYKHLTIDAEKFDRELSVYKNADIAMLLVQDGPTNADLCCALGLMQARSLRGKPTIFITTARAEAASQLCGYFNDNSGYALAKPYFLHYGSSGNLKSDPRSMQKYSKYMNNLLGIAIEVNPGVDNDVDMPEDTLQGTGYAESGSKTGFAPTVYRENSTTKEMKFGDMFTGNGW